MNKVYIITYKSTYSDGTSASGISFVYDNYEKAKKMLETIKQDEISNYQDNGINIRARILCEENSFTIDSGSDTDKYSIIEMDVK